MGDITGLTGFYRIAAADPGRRAVIDQDGTVTTYGELLTLVNAVTHGLRARGAGHGDVVAGVLPNGVDALALPLAACQTGMHYVPVNWHLTTGELGYILRDCGARIVVTAEPYEPAVRAGAAEGAEVLRGAAALACGMPSGPPGDRRAGAMLWYTSGTTGVPKGVQRVLRDGEPEETVARHIWFFGEVCDLRPGDGVHLVTAPIYHSAPSAHSFFALHMGHTVVLAPHFDPERVLGLIEEYGVTNTLMVPTMFHRLLRLPEAVRAKYDVSSLAQVMHTGAACPVPVKQAIMSWWGPVVYEYYGSTESAIPFAVKPGEWLARPGTVGRPSPTFEAVILDDEGHELPPGEPGLVYVRSSGNRFEYRDDPAGTAARKRGDWYTPGDIGYFDHDGYLFLCDRRADLIVSGGVNIYPAEVEAALITHPAVADVAVIGVPDEEWGHNVVALVQPTPAAGPGPELAAALLAHCEPRIARFKRPKLIEFVTELPRTPTGKLSRRRVRDDYLAARPARP
ncbi:AMP-binding protein [Spongiactinospora sp. 9N601]|uniref:AMP-binding protein n=1 Tax=Spongiactinospora sp. 9N601 TaxID=3375149 RepID=UPI00379AB348